MVPQVHEIFRPDSGYKGDMLFRTVMALATACGAAFAADYFPPPDSRGGWRQPASAAEARRAAGIDPAKLDEVFAYIQGNTKNGGLLVARRGWLVYERYFGRAGRDAMPNTASCGKSFTSIAVGILLARYPKAFPDGLDQKIWRPEYLPPEAFPPSDPLKLDIRLGQALAMTSGIRGNNPGLVHGKEVMLDPAGPDGWQAMIDEAALGNTTGNLSSLTLWRRPGEGYSYATASIHLASMVVRRVSGMELEEFVREHLAKPMGWGPFEWGYRRPEVRHTPGGGGIAPRATDMLRFAYMLLREGRWGGRQLVPAEYVRHCGRPSPYNPHAPVSLAFDVNGRGDVPGLPRDAFWKRGSGGHCFYVVPSLDLVVWKLGGRDEQYGPGGQHPSRAAWKQSVSDGEAATRTLEMVTAALR
jgi:CubicO group peptidase (beta-lactamase class C family)